MDNPILQAVAGIIILVLAGLGIKLNNNREKSDSDEITIDSKPTRRDTILMLMTDRVHAVRNDLGPQIGKLQLEDARLDLRVTQNTADILRLRVDMETGFKGVNEHIDTRCTKIEESIDKAVDRIWQKIDSK